MGWKRENRALLVCDSHSHPQSLCVRNGNILVTGRAARASLEGAREGAGQGGGGKRRAGRWFWAGHGAGTGVALPGGCFLGEVSTWEVLEVSPG